MIGPSIEFKEVSLKIGSTSILESLSLKVASNTIHTITGPNGAGKSSLIKCLLGSMPHRGEIEIDWKEGKGKIGYMPQTIAFDKSLPMTVMDFMGLMTYGGTKKSQKGRIKKTLKSLSMDNRSSRLMGELSGGELKRTLFSQAIVNDPSMLILDEPAAGLDEAGETILMEGLESFKASGGTVLWICHDMEKMLGHADCVTVIKKKVISSGTPSEVFSNNLKDQR